MLALHGPVLQDTQGRVNHGPETGRSACLDLGRCTTVIPAHTAAGNCRSRAAVASGLRGCRLALGSWSAMGSTAIFQRCLSIDTFDFQPRPGLATSNSGPSPPFHCILIVRIIQESW